MLNKKNIALAMSATMVASAVAPVFAAVEEAETNFVVDASNKDAVIAKVGELLGVKYTSKLADGEIVESEESVYEISIEDEVVSNKTDFRNKLNAALEGKTLVDVTVTDKGHKVVGDEIINYVADTYTLSTLLGVVDDEDLADYVDGEIEEVDGKVVITLLSGEVIELGVGDTVLDFTKAYDAEGELTEVAEEVVSFGVVYSEIESVDYTVQVTTTEVKEIGIDAIFDGVFLTEEGLALAEFMNESDTHEVTVEEIHTTVEVDGEEEEQLTGLEIIISRAIGLSALEDGQELRITVNGDEEQLTALKGILVDGNTTPTKLAGAERYETAVEVSKEYRKDGSASTDAVVLASATSLVDGLAAGPLAAQLNTSILLTKANELPEVTKDEIYEVLNIEDTKVSELKDKTVYVVGGESVIGEEVVAELEAMGVTVERIAGTNRHETSLAVADKLVELKGGTTTESFIVGANGLADAMSISAYAAKTKNPIIVTDFGHTVSEEAIEFIEDKELTVIGGESTVSEELLAELDEANEDNTVTRLHGKDRLETNAEVINHFYTDADAIFVAKDGYKGGNDKLVDALTAAPLAAKKNAPIVLATTDLTESQKEVLELVEVADSNSVFQIGGGIVNTVIAKISDLLK